MSLRASACFIDGTASRYSCSKVVCVGRNYAAHAKELNNPIPTQPIYFIKPESSIQQNTKLQLHKEGLHYEAELAVLIGRDISRGEKFVASQDIAGLGLALDLTDRELQSELKTKGHPWERAKAFDGACYLTKFVPFEGQRLDSLAFELRINNEVRQHGESSQMLFDIDSLIVDMLETFSLKAGDVILTGTPEGVGVLHHADELELSLLPNSDAPRERHTFDLLTVSI